MAAELNTSKLTAESHILLVSEGKRRSRQGLTTTGTTITPTSTRTRQAQSTEYDTLR